MSTESAINAVECATRPAASSAKNMAALIHRTRSSTRRCRSWTGGTEQQASMGLILRGEGPAQATAAREEDLHAAVARACAQAAAGLDALDAAGRRALVRRLVDRAASAGAR